MLQNLNELVTPIVEKISRFDVLDCSLPRAFTESVSTIFNCSVAYGVSASCITNRKGQRIFLSNNWFYIAAILAPLHKPFYEYKDLLNNIVEKEILKEADFDRIKQIINSNSTLSEQDKEYLIKFATEPLWWNGGNSNTGGKSLDRNDALVSSVLSIANLVNASQSYVATLWEFFGENPGYAALLNSTADNLIENNEVGAGVYGRTTDIQKIFFGTPGSGKSFKVEGIVKGHEEFTFRTTFHPDSDYATFVGAYKPVKKGDELTYEFVPQAFTDAYVKAWNCPYDDIYLVIEEINRGNCAQIFGDLFQLLDRDKNNVSEYPIKADKDLRNYLETEGVLGEGHEGIRDGKLKLPANFHILATMNTSDQSLFPMDSAFKRRWAWEYVPIAPDNEKSQFTITVGDRKYPWASFLEKANERIHRLSDSEDKQMGNFFIKSDIDVEEFKSKVMFYLWSEVCKDYEKSGSFFKDAFSEDAEFTFNSLFPTDDTTNKRLQGFMAYLGVEEKKSDATVSGGASGEPAQS